MIQFIHRNRRPIGISTTQEIEVKDKSKANSPKKGILKTYIRRPFFILAIVAVLLVPSVSQAQSPNTKLIKLSQRLKIAQSNFKNAKSQLQRFSVFRVQGEIISGANTPGVAILGTAVGITQGSDSSLGWSRTPAVLVVFNHAPLDINQGHFDGFFVYKGTYIVGSKTCSGYDRAPEAFFRAYLSAKAKLEYCEQIESEINQIKSFEQQKLAKEAQQAEEQEQRVQRQQKLALEAQFRKRSATRVSAFNASNALKEAASSDKAAFLSDAAQKGIDLYNELGRGGYLAFALGRQSVLNLLRSAVLDAEAGNLNRASASISKALKQEISVSQNSDVFAIVNSNNRAPSVLSQSILAENPALTRRLADAWVLNLPKYLKADTNEGQIERVKNTTVSLNTYIFTTNPVVISRLQQILLMDYPKTFGDSGSSITSNPDRETIPTLSNNHEQPAASHPVERARVIPPFDFTGGIRKLEVSDVIEGDGKVAMENDALSINYMGVLLNGQKFDQSRELTTFKIGDKSLPNTLQNSILGMKEKGTRRIVIPANQIRDLATALRGNIPDNATLTYEVELVKVTPPVLEMAPDFYFGAVNNKGNKITGKQYEGLISGLKGKAVVICPFVDTQYDAFTESLELFSSFAISHPNPDVIYMPVFSGSQYNLEQMISENISKEVKEKYIFPLFFTSYDVKKPDRLKGLIGGGNDTYYFYQRMNGSIYSNVTVINPLGEFIGKVGILTERKAPDYIPNLILNEEELQVMIEKALTPAR